MMGQPFGFSRWLGLGLSIPELRVLDDSTQPPITVDGRITQAGDDRYTQAGDHRVVDET